jgi:hypothetical protein
MVAAWLRVQSTVLLFGAAMFGLAFPVIGAAIGLFGLAPPGEDPLGPAMGMCIAGPCTAVIYVFPGVLCAMAARRYALDPAGSLVWVVLASAFSSVVCVVGLAPIALLALEPRSPD